MGQAIKAFPVKPHDWQTVPLGDGKFRITLTWRERCRAWYLDVYTAAGVAVALGRRVSPGYGPLLDLSLPTGPEGMIIASGKDPYRREDFGDSVRLVYYEEDELPAAETPEFPLRVSA